MHAGLTFLQEPLEIHHQLLTEALADWTRVTVCDEQSFVTFTHIILGRIFHSDLSPEGLLPQEFLHPVGIFICSFHCKRGKK